MKNGSSQSNFKSICSNRTLNSKYSWRELFEMIGVNNQAELDKFFSDNER